MTRRRPWRVVGLALAVLLALAAAWGAFEFIRVAAEIRWDCAAGSCATDDPRSLWLPLGILGTLVAAVTAVVCRPDCVGAAVAGFAFAATGAAVHLGVAADPASTDGPAALGTLSIAIGAAWILGALVAAAVARFRRQRD